MLIVETINEFVDKNTKVLHKKGSTFSCTLDRFNEIQSVGKFVKMIGEEAEKIPAEEVKEKTAEETAEKVIEAENKAEAKAKKETAEKPKGKRSYVRHK